MNKLELSKEILVFISEYFQRKLGTAKYSRLPFYYLLSVARESKTHFLYECQKIILECASINKKHDNSRPHCQDFSGENAIFF